MAIAAQGVVRGTVDDVQLSRIPARLACIRRQALNAYRELGRRAHRESRIRADRIPAIGQGRRAPQGALAFATDPNRGVRLLHWLGQKVNVGKATVLSLKGRILTGPQLFEGAQ